MLGMFFVMLLGTFMVSWTSAQRETFTGNVSESDNKTWIGELFMTTVPTNIVNMQFNLSVKLKVRQCNPIIYLRHEHQQGYGTESGCFKLGEHEFIRAFDVRLLHKDYNDNRCAVNGNIWTCSDSLNISNGYPVRRTASVGYRCEEECADKFLELDYSVQITEISQVPCRLFRLDDIPSDFQNVKDIAAQCQAIYPTYSAINLFGIDIDTMNSVFAAVSSIFESMCYQHTVELTCRIMFPECRNASLVYPCREMCEDIMIGCPDQIKQADFPIECNTMQHLTNNNTSCVYQTVQCQEPKDSLPHGDVVMPTAPFGYGSLVTYTCHPPYLLKNSGESTCQMSGQWINLTEEPTCIFPEYIIITVSVLVAVMLVAALAGLIYHFWLEIRVLLANSCMSRRHTNYTEVKCGDMKAFHAFLCFAEEDRQHFAIPLLGELEDKNDYRMCIHHRNFLAGEYIEENILTAIGESYRVIIVLSQAYLQSNWCIFEFEQAYLRSVSNPLFRLIVILIEEPKKLTGLKMPPLMKAHLRTHTYIQQKDALFLQKLKAVLPRYPVRRSSEEAQAMFVRGSMQDIIHVQGDVINRV